MGLYDNEMPRLWDPEFDSVVSASIQHEDEEIKKAIEEGHSLALLKSSEGYKALEKFLTESITNLKAKLLSAHDFETVRRLQEAIKSYTNVLVFVDYKIHEGKALEQQRTPEKGLIQGENHVHARRANH